jgi:hypothetical protein
MLKKISITILAVFYLVVTSGVMMNIHYCMGKVSSVSFIHEKDHSDGSCNKCGMDKTENHCCKDEAKSIKLSDTHQSLSYSFELASLSSVQPQRYILLNEAEQGVSGFPIINYSSTPPKTFNKVYLDVNTFRI